MGAVVIPNLLHEMFRFRVPVLQEAGQWFWTRLSRWKNDIALCAALLELLVFRHFFREMFGITFRANLGQISAVMQVNSVFYHDFFASLPMSSWISTSVAFSHQLQTKSFVFFIFNWNNFAMINCISSSQFFGFSLSLFFMFST